MSSPKIFLNKNVFEESYVPRRILHRNEQIHKIRQILSDIERFKSRPSNMMFIGGFGSGKTALIRSFSRDLPLMFADCVFAYVNCSKSDTETRVYRAALEQLGVSAKHGFPGDFYVRWFQETVGLHQCVLLILDEINVLLERDSAEANRLFYFLSRLVNNVVVVMLTNRVTFPATLRNELDSGTLDTFRWETISFGGYYCNELSDILEDRCKIGFQPGTYDKGIIAMMAKCCYDQGLSARGLMSLAFRAGEEAEQNNHATIMEEDVREANSQLMAVQDLEVVRRLSPPTLAVLAYIQGKSPIYEVAHKQWQSYAAEHKIGGSETRFQLRVKELEDLALIIREIRGKGRGRGQVTRLLINPSMADVVRQALQPEEEETHGTTATTRNEEPL